MNLKGKRILLTGATGGLGQSLATALADKGAILSLVGRDDAKLAHLKHVLEKQGSSAHTITADLSEMDAIAFVSKHARRQMGGIDILINNAGVMDFIKFEDQHQGRIAQMIETNVTIPIQFTREIIPDFIARDEGQVVFVGSIFGSLGFPYFATYCASKFAIHGFSQSLRRELMGTKIGVSYIAPRGIKTPMNDANTVAMWAKTGSRMDAAEVVASRIVKALEKEQQEVFIGEPQSFFAWLNGLFPRLVTAGLKKDTRIAREFL
ncbi:MAG TPA: SDR family oxidoreductase [Methylophilus sp.]|uniref:SDR family oxidoreductase n=1 Tax=Methylophilus sp. TaxID=29541 RepID=UPI002B99B1A8|nr:SDR family oxidoreductase [Methylophilus sp.]HSH86605.1 SDR family oxidoreductase [Methylophilus sp.]